MRFEIKYCSVLDADADIIVNAANNYLSSGGGVCGAIFAKAGELELEAECKEYGFVPTGSATITNGLKTGAKYVIHAVGPNIYIDRKDYNNAIQILTYGIKYNGNMEDLYYNRACCYSILGEVEKALDDLEKSISISEDIIQYVKWDKDFSRIKKTSRFKKLIEDKRRELNDSN